MSGPKPFVRPVRHSLQNVVWDGVIWTLLRISPSYRLSWLNRLRWLLYWREQKCICHPDNHSIRPIPIISLWVGYLLNGCCHCRYWTYTSGQCDLGFVHGQNISEQRRDFKQRETRRETRGNHMYIFYNCLYLINKEKWLLKYFLNVCTPCELSPNALILFL